MKRLVLAAAAACALTVAGCGGHAHRPLHGGRTHSPAFLHAAETARLAPTQLFTLSPSLPGYDAVTVGNVPRGARVVGCYATGSYANCSAAHARNPGAQLVTITPTASYVPATCLDTEPGDSTPDQVAGWIVRDHAAGVARPCDYADASEMVQVKADVAAAGIARSTWLAFVAAWDGNPAIPGGDDAKQWRSTATLDYDTFATYFFTTAPGPKPKPKPFNYHYSRYPTLTLYNAPGRVCSHGCNERQTVQEYDRLRRHSRKHHTTLLALRYRMQWFDRRIVALNKTRPHAITVADWGTWRQGQLGERGFHAKEIG